MTWSALESESSVRQAIVSVLAEAGVRYVVGMPGGYTIGLFSALHEHPDIRVIQVREESIGSTMAEAYGRLTGVPMVIMGQGEWIVGNAGQGILEALLGSSPIIVLTEMTDAGPLSHHGPYQGGSGDYGAWDARKALEAVTKRVMVSTTPAQAVQHTQLAVKHALTGEPGPVAVVFHGSSLRGKVGPTSSPRIFPTDGYLPRRSAAADPDVVARVVERIRRAERPVIVAGNGVRVGQGCASLASLAAALDTPVATTASGKGVYPEDDPLAAGTMGTFGQPSTNALVGTADLILAIGTKLGPIDSGDEHPELIDPARQVLIQVDVEPLNAGWTFPVDEVLIGDGAVMMEALRAAYQTAENEAPLARTASGADRVANALSRYGELETADALSDEVPFAPQRIIRIMQETLPIEAVVTADAGENRLFMMHWYRSRSTDGGYLQPAAGGGMGYAVPAAMGAKLARPDRPAVAVCGDGGFAMSMHALMSAAQERIPVTVVVFNNNALGWVLHGMGDRPVAASLDSFDYAGVASAIGCDATRVSTPEELRAALARITDIERPLVIEVPTSLKSSFHDVAQSFDSAPWRETP